VPCGAVEKAGPPLRPRVDGEPRGGRRSAAPAQVGRRGAKSAPAHGRAPADSGLTFDAGDRDPADLAQASAELWAGLFIDETARAVLRRDGFDLARLPLSGPHPFVFVPAVGGVLTAVSIPGMQDAATESLFDLFRVYFLRRLST
jgi:hypothetical protein